MTNIKKSSRVISLLLVLLSICGMLAVNTSTSFADETEPTETTSVTANNDEQKENYVFVNKLKKGNLDVTKTAEDGLVEGFKFHLTGTSMSGQPIDLTATTGKDGIAHFKDIPIGTDFKLNEIEIPDRYVTPDEQTVVIEYNKLTQATMHNALKKVNIFVTKTAEDGVIEGRTFEITGTTEGGQEFKQTGATNSEGKLTFSDVPYGDYIVREIDAPNYYVVPDEQEVTINADKDVNLTFDNTLKKGSVQLIKVDSKNPDKKLSGAEFAVYKDTNGDGVYADTDELIGYMEEVSKGVYFYDNLPFGNYFVNETKAPEGYNLDPTFYGFVINSEDTVTVQNKDGVFVNEEIPTQPTTTPPDTPQTGQKSYVVPLLIIIILSVGVIIFFIIRNKKKNK